MVKNKITQLFSDDKQTGMSVSILVALIYAAFLVFVVDWMPVYEFDPDEGYNVIKALMLEDGFILYDEILSDQPPAFTYILWLTFKVFGWHVNAGRMVVIAFVSLMIFGIYDSVRRIYGSPVALGAVLFLVLSNKFTQVSVSVMLGQPSLSMLVMSGWALIVWYTQRQTVFLLVSGVLLGISVSIKLYTLFICPVVFLCIILFGKKCPYRKTQKLVINQLTLWSIAIAISSLFFLSPVLFSNDPIQLITSHSNKLLEGGHPQKNMLWKFILENWIIIFMSVPGVVYSLKIRNLVGTFYGLWWGFALVILFFHHPIWYHHAFLFLIPASVMASLSVYWIVDTLVKKNWNKRKATLLGLSVVLLVAISSLTIYENRARRLIHPWKYSKNSADQLATEVINYYAGPEHTMITSRQMFAFRTKSLVPPSLAVTSIKRHEGGLWDAETVIEKIEKGGIEQVVLNSRWKRPAWLIKESIQAKYTKVYSDKNNRELEIFVRNDIVANKLPFERK